MWHDDLRGILYIAFKDMRTYYLKPPSISWGIVFPMAWVLAFYLRTPQNFEQLVPGLVAMTILFSTTAAEAVVINFELRLGSLERLLLAPISLPAVLAGKVTGGAIFGFMMTVIVTLGAELSLGLQVDLLCLTSIVVLSLIVFSSLGALLCVLVKEVFEAQTLLNLPRFIMIFLSGVLYPVSSMPPLLQYLAYLMPLTYTVDGLRQSFSASQDIFFFVDIMVLLGFFAIFISLAARLLHRRFE